MEKKRETTENRMVQESMKTTENAGASVQAEVETKKEMQMDPFVQWAHRFGRTTLLCFIVYMLIVPIAICAVYDCFPSFKMLVPGLITILLIMVPTGIAEVGSYTPILGSSSYLTFATGNLMNLKMPCVVNAQKLAKVEQSTPEGDAIALIATAVSSIVTIVILAVGLIFIVPLQPLLSNPYVATASNYIMPALFGCMALSLFGNGGGKTYVRNRLLCAVVPAVLVALLTIAGIASSGIASYLLIVMIPLTILCARILWKKGVVKVAEVEKKE